MSLTRRSPSSEATGPVGSSAEPRDDDDLRCDQCGRRIKGRPAARGLFLWARGEEIRYEEPPLCARCASPARYGSMELDIDE